MSILLESFLLKCNYAIVSSSHDICKHYLVKCKYTLVLSDVVKRPLKHVSAIPRTVQSSSCTSLFAPPPQCPPTSPPPLLEHILPLASVCKAVSSFQHLQQMYVELKPVSNSCVYKTLFAQTRVIHLKLKPLSSLQCR